MSKLLNKNFSFFAFYGLLSALITFAVCELIIYGYNGAAALAYYILIIPAVLLFFVCYYQNRCGTVKQKLACFAIKTAVYLTFVVILIYYYVYVGSLNQEYSGVPIYFACLAVCTAIAALLVPFFVLEGIQLKTKKVLQKKATAKNLIIFLMPAYIFAPLLVMFLVYAGRITHHFFLIFYIFLVAEVLISAFAALHFVFKKSGTLSLVFMTFKYALSALFFIVFGFAFFDDVLIFMASAIFLVNLIPLFIREGRVLELFTDEKAVADTSPAAEEANLTKAVIQHPKMLKIEKIALITIYSLAFAIIAALCIMAVAENNELPQDILTPLIIFIPLAIVQFAVYFIKGLGKARLIIFLNLSAAKAMIVFGAEILFSFYNFDFSAGLSILRSILIIIYLVLIFIGALSEFIIFLRMREKPQLNN